MIGNRKNTDRYNMSIMCTLQILQNIELYRKTDAQIWNIHYSYSDKKIR